MSIAPDVFRISQGEAAYARPEILAHYELMREQMREISPSPIVDTGLSILSLLSRQMADLRDSRQRIWDRICMCRDTSDGLGPIALGTEFDDWFDRPPNNSTFEGVV